MGEDSIDAETNKAPATRLTGLLQLLVILLFLGLAFFYSRAPSVAQVLEDAVILDEKTLDIRPRVRTVRPVVDEVTLSIETTGTLNVPNQVALIPQVSGQVVWVSPHLRAGGAFDSNETLLIIDSRDFELTLAQANADLATQRANLLLAEAQSQAAKENWDLLHAGQSIPPLVAKVPQIKQAEAAIASAEARVQLAELNLSRTTFKLPFRGRVVSSTAALGQLISMNQPFGQVYALDAIEANVPVSSVELALIAPAVGRDVIVKTPTQTLHGTVERVSADVDQRSREARLYVRFNDPVTVPPGSFLNVVVKGPVYKNTFVLPDLTEQANESFWIVKDGLLDLIESDIIARIPRGLVVPAFDAAQGVVLGSIPGAKVGLAVTVADEES